RRVKTESRRSWWHGEGCNWSTAFATTGMAAVLIALFLIATPHRKPAEVAQSTNRVRPVPVTREVEVEPTFGSYRMLANRSLDLLDQELTAEAKQSPVNTQTY